MTELMKELTLMQSAVAQMEETLDDKLQVTGVSMDAEAETLRGRNGVAGRKADFFRRCFPFRGSHRG